MAYRILAILLISTERDHAVFQRHGSSSLFQSLATRTLTVTVDGVPGLSGADALHRVALGSVLRHDDVITRQPTAPVNLARESGRT